jgi:uncharacterized protein
MKNIKMLLVIAVILLVSACVPTPIGKNVEESIRTININGVGTVSLTPDMATIRIGVSTNNKNAEIAVSQNNKQANKIMSVFTALDIAPEDIKTSNFNVYPRQKYDDDGNVTSVIYQVSNSVSVTVKDLDILGELLNKVVEAGANNINSISFDVADREAAYQQALSAAMDNAQQRAEVLANAADSTLGNVQSVSAHIGGGGEVYPVEKAMIMSDSSVPISAGGLDIQVQVSVVYEIE